MINIDTTETPLQIAKWLTIAQAQRSRAATKAVQDFGEESASATELKDQTARIGNLVNTLVKLQADAPKRAR